jgi:putative membrane protein
MKSASIAMGAALLCLGATQAMAALSAADKTFATKAAAGGQAEVELGQLATRDASAPAVKQFGERMVTDHTQANQALIEIARQKNLTLPSTPDAADQATEKKLSALKGHAFDSAYMQDMVQDHQKDVADFRNESETGQDPDLKAFAAKYLPVIEHHLQMAQAAERE